VKALVYGGPGSNTRQDAPDPVIVHPADVIVRGGTATIGGTDLHRPAGDVPTVQNDRTPGYEDQADRSEVGITELSSTEWRVSDRTVDAGDPSGVLGFIQRLGNFYEVTNLRRLRERSYFSSFDRATASLAAGTVLA